MNSAPKTVDDGPRRVVADRCRDGRCRSCRGCEHTCHAQTLPADFRAQVRAETARRARTRDDDTLWANR